MAALIVAQFAAADGIAAIYAMLPAIYREFPARPVAVRWIVTTFFLVAAMSSAIGGRLADLMGRRNIAIIVLLAGSVGSLIGALATSPVLLILASIPCGMTLTLTPVLIGLARETLPEHRVGLGIGAISAAGSAGAGLVYVIVGYVLDTFGRPGGYLYTAIVAILAAGSLFVAIPRAPRARAPLAEIDMVRGLLFGPGVGGLVLAVQFAAQRGLADSLTLVSAVASIGLLAYWTLHQVRQERPLIELRLLGRPRILRVLLAMLVLGIAGIQQGQMFTITLQHRGAGAGFGLSATAAGALMLPINAVALIVAPLAGGLSRRFGSKRIALLGAVLIALSWIGCALTLQSLPAFLAAATLSLAGLNMLIPSLYILLVEETPVRMTSGAMGFAYTIFDVGFAIGSQIVLGLVMTGDVAGGPAQFRAAYHVLAAGTALIVLLMIGHDGKRTWER